MLQTLIKLDKRLNGLLGGNPDRTISYRLGRYIESSKRPLRAWAARVFCRTVLLPLAIIFRQGWKHCRETDS